MTKPVRHLFADAAALIEDMHAVAVEGQAQGLSPDMVRVLVVNLCSGVRRLDGAAKRIIAALDEGSGHDGL